MIEIEGLRKEYDNVLAIEGLSLKVGNNEVYGLVGPNGAGKTTTMRIVCGLLEPTEGRVQVNGIDVVHEPEQAREHIGFLSDFFSLYEDLKVWEYLDYFAHAYKLPESEIRLRVEEMVHEAGLECKRDALIHGLSRGMKQRLGIARAMIHQPQVLVLDEPASGLDPKARVELRNQLKAVRDRGTTILISSHILTELEGLCTAIGIMEGGHLVRSGRMEDMMLETKAVRRVRLRWLGDEGRLRSVLAGHAQVSMLELDAGHGEFAFGAGERELSELLTALVNSGAGVIDFYEARPTFEQIYMKLSSHKVS
jgi:ABC-2 type transport system ATP-binding protein